nr:hypothetical protein [Lysinibacillus timonensis]
MKKTLLLIGFFLSLVLVIALGVYEKKTNEREQLVISEVRYYISNFEDREVLITDLEIQKPSFFSSYEEWTVISNVTNNKYRYSDGLVSIIN